MLTFSKKKKIHKVRYHLTDLAKIPSTLGAQRKHRRDLKLRLRGNY